MEEPRAKQIQEYDSSLKVLFGEEAGEILPYLLPGTELLYDHNIEIDRTTLKADLVYNILCNDLPHILNMELQTSEDKNMHLRLLQYHVNLYARYHVPVLSVVLYPFEQKVPVPPFKEWSGEDLLMLWKYQVIGLYNLEAERFRHERAYCMYSLLPAMKGATAPMLIQTLQDLQTRYSQYRLRHHLDRFWKMLQKSVTISEEDRIRVEEEMRMHYDWFIDTVPQVIERVEQAEKRGEERGELRGEMRGEIKGKVEGELEALRQVALDIVEDRFPDLVDFARTEVATTTQPGLLHKLIRDLGKTSDEIKALQMLKQAKQGA